MRIFKINSRTIEHKLLNIGGVVDTDKCYPSVNKIEPQENDKIPFVARSSFDKSDAIEVKPRGKVTGDFSADFKGLYAEGITGSSAVIFLLFPKAGENSKTFFCYYTNKPEDWRDHVADLILSIKRDMTVQAVIMVNNDDDRLLNAYADAVGIILRGASDQSCMFEWYTVWDNFCIVPSGFFGHYYGNDIDMHKKTPPVSPVVQVSEQKELFAPLDPDEQLIEGSTYQLKVHQSGVSGSVSNSDNYRTYDSTLRKYFRQPFASYQEGNLGVILRAMRSKSVVEGFPWVFRAHPYREQEGEKSITLTLLANNDVAWNKISDNKLSDICYIDLNEGRPSGIVGNDYLYKGLPSVMIGVFLKKNNVYLSYSFSLMTDSGALVRSNPYQFFPSAVVGPSMKDHEAEILIICHLDSREQMQNILRAINSAFSSKFEKTSTLCWTVYSNKFAVSVTSESITFGCDMEFWRNRIKTKNQISESKVTAISNNQGRGIEICGNLMEVNAGSTRSSLPQLAPIGGVKPETKLTLFSAFTNGTHVKIPDVQSDTSDGCLTLLYAQDSYYFGSKQSSIVFGELDESSILIIALQPERNNYPGKSPGPGNTFEKILIFHTTQPMLEMLCRESKNPISAGDLARITRIKQRISGSVTLPELCSLLFVKYNSDSGYQQWNSQLLEMISVHFNTILSSGKISNDRITTFVTTQKLFSFSVYCNQPANCIIPVGMFGAFGKPFTDACNLNPSTYKVSLNM